MQVVRIASETDFAGWRAAARRLRLAGVPPSEVAWTVAADDLLQACVNEETSSLSEGCAAPFTVPPAFLKLADTVICHRSPERLELLYALLWRLRDEPRLLDDLTDPQVAKARHMQRVVARAAHKMRAFVRFRAVRDRRAAPEHPETFVAWFEPPHRVLEREAPFFVGRFANHRFSILTPDLCAHWDGRALTFTPGATRDSALAEDEVEAYWLTYYASIFNPARLKVAAMQSEMPKRYWRNLPEASLIPQLIEGARERTETMVARGPTEPGRRLPERPAAARAEVPPDEPNDLPAIAEALQSCRRCDLWRDATQGVPGEGPKDAPLMLVGEQPGDTEDLAGRPFIGPAGQLLDRALEKAGLPRERVWVTNAVKHFKHQPTGKRRLHRTPTSGEIVACRWWLDHERRLVRPKVVVAMGGSAALAVFGRAVPIMRSRGQIIGLADGAKGMVTVHPSYLLRLPDRDAKAAAFEDFVRDLAMAAELID